MFGADTPLVMDALQMAAVAAVAGAGAIFLLMRQRKSAEQAPGDQPRARTDLESRVEVLERIATDRSIDLAEEIEALRDAPDARHLEGHKA